MDKVRLAVIGSCATRDPFNSRFNPHWRDLFDVVAMLNQTSLITIMDKPTPADTAQIDNLGEIALAEARNELDKSFLTDLVKAQPDYIVFDFFTDVHFGIIESDGRYFTNNRWKIAKTTFFQNLPNRVELAPIADAEQYLSLWRPSIDRLIEYIRAGIPGARIVVHGARKVRYKQTSDGPKEISARYDIARYNELWDTMDDYLVSRHGAAWIEMFDQEYMSFEEHPWKGFFVHYQMDYYPRFLSKLTQLVVAELQSELARRPVEQQSWRKSALAKTRRVLKSNGSTRK